MQVAQSGIFALGTGSHSYLEFDLLGSADPGALVQAIANLRELRTTTGGLNLVAGLRPSLWRQGVPGGLPADVTDLDEDVRGVDGYTMPATQHDPWLWVAGHAYDKVFDVTKEAVQALAQLATLALEVAGWTYRENRDLTGFIDGTENPPLSEAPEVALSVFTSSLESHLAILHLSGGVQQVIEVQRTRLAGITIPMSVSGKVQVALKRAIDESFVSAFRLVSLLGAALALLSACSAWVLIEGRHLKPAEAPASQAPPGEAGEQAPHISAN